MKKSRLVILVLIYFIANILLLLSDGLWWDDWVIFGHSQIPADTGQYIACYIHSIIMKSFDLDIVPYFYRCIAFVSSLINLFLIHKILKYANFTDDLIFLILLFVVALPMFSAKMTISCMIYYLSIPFFYGGTYELCKYLYTGNWMYRFLSICLFFISLLIWHHAVVVIPILVFILILSKRNELLFDKVNSATVLKYSLRYIDFFLLPIAFFVIRNFFLMPKNVYQDYYSVKLESILISPFNLIQFYFVSFADYFNTITEYCRDNHLTIFLPMLLSFVTFYILKNKLNYDLSICKLKVLFLISTILFLSAVVPFAVIGQSLILFEDMSSRYQSLLILPFAIMIVCIIMLINYKFIRLLLFSVFLSFSLFSSIILQLNYQRGWCKSLALMELIKSESRLQEHSINILVQDNLNDWNEYPNQAWNNYVYTGISRLMLHGDQSQLYEIIESRGSTHVLENDNAHMSFKYLLVLNRKRELTNVDVLCLTFDKIFNNRKFKQQIKELISYDLVLMSCQI